MDDFEEIGKQILLGKKLQGLHLNGKEFRFEYTYEQFIDQAIRSGWPREFAEECARNYKPVQMDFVSDFTSDYCLNSGGFGSGKSIALYVKLILLCKCFPGNRVLLGRKTLQDIDRAVLPELFDLMPKSWYHHRVKDG